MISVMIDQLPDRDHEPPMEGSTFWAAAAEGRLVHPRCHACGRAWFPPAIACPSCLSEDVGWEESRGEGRLHSWTVVHRAPTPDREVPYVVAVVDLDEGFDLLTNLVDADPATLRIEQPVRLAWRERAGRREPVFRVVAS